MSDAIVIFKIFGVLHNDVRVTATPADIGLITVSEIDAQTRAGQEVSNVTKTLVDDGDGVTITLFIQGIVVYSGRTGVYIDIYPTREKIDGSIVSFSMRDVYQLYPVQSFPIGTGLIAFDNLIVETYTASISRVNILFVIETA